MAEKQDNGLERLNFLRALGGASTAAVAAATALVPGDAQAYDPGPDETGTKYQPDAPGVQAFYRTNGYETLKK